MGFFVPGDRREGSLTRVAPRDPLPSLRRAGILYLTTPPLCPLPLTGRAPLMGGDVESEAIMVIEAPEKFLTPALAPIVREISADLETPTSAYLKLRRNGPSFLLQSVEGGEQVARYSFIGVEPRCVYTLRGRTLERSENGETELLP